jgi:hypothetical protein
MKRKKEIVNGVIGVVVFFTVRAAVARGVTGVVVVAGALLAIGGVVLYCWR